MCITKFEAANLKRLYTVFSNYMTLSKKKNYKDDKKICGCQVWGGRGRAAGTFVLG